MGMVYGISCIVTQDEASVKLQPIANRTLTKPDPLCFQDYGMLLLD
jgi:hypothetical protein